MTSLAMRVLVAMALLVPTGVRAGGVYFSLAVPVPVPVVPVVPVVPYGWVVQPYPYVHPAPPYAAFPYGSLRYGHGHHVHHHGCGHGGYRGFRYGHRGHGVHGYRLR